ncbi:MAG TPA: TIGR00725 family protein, partial [Thermodesulfobacteriota bacterium]|nr:TIGR00725 family protein [Thermodesulfobacteriota bacterium]
MDEVRTAAEPLYVAVIGEGEAGPQALADAEAVGRLLAARGAVVVCGGMGGVMDAAARGARAAGGVSIGILPGTRREEGSPALTYRLPTGLGHARNPLVVLAADAVIAIGGRAGTLTEIGYALIYRKPVIGLRTWTLARPEVGPGPLVEAVPTAETAVER